MNKITFCIPSKNNLRYLKTCIPSIRENAYRKDHDIIIFVDSDEDGTVKWLESNKDIYNLSYYVNPDLGNSLYGIGKAYDFCIEKSNTEVFMIFHADMILGKDADLKAYEFIADRKEDNKFVVCSTRIEPPIHPNNGEKILQDFGMWPEDFQLDNFNNFVDNCKIENELKTTEGVFAPWMMYKDEFLSIGGHDHIFHSAREDSDVFNRLHLVGFTFIQSWESLVYHFTGRGGQFQHGQITQDHEQKSIEWQKLMANSTKEFIRKWGSLVKHTRFMKPIVSPKYDIGIRVKNANLELVRLLEPWCDKLYIDNLSELAYKYFEEEQKNTKYDLKKRIFSSHLIPDTDILVDIDKNTFTQNDYLMIQQLPDIIKSEAEVGIYELGNLTIEVALLEEYQDKLISSNLQDNNLFISIKYKSHEES